MATPTTRQTERSAFYALRHIRDVESPSPTVLQNKLRSNKRFYRQSNRCDFSATPFSFFTGDETSPLRCCRRIVVFNGWMISAPTPRFINYYLFNILYSLNQHKFQFGRRNVAPTLLPLDCCFQRADDIRPYTEIYYLFDIQYSLFFEQRNARCFGQTRRSVPTLPPWNFNHCRGCNKIIPNCELRINTSPLHYFVTFSFLAVLKNSNAYLPLCL